jgi:hypothetical protein
VEPAAMRRNNATSGIAIVQALTAMALVVIAGMASVQALVLTNQKAATMRTVNNARAIVQRNIDTALGVPFSASATVPPILATTVSTGVLHDEDGDGNTNVNVVVGRNGTDKVVEGTLTRIVTAEPNSAGADIRRITFRVNYTYRSRPYSFSMTTLRTTD